MYYIKTRIRIVLRIDKNVTSMLQCLSKMCVISENRFRRMLSHRTHWHIISSMLSGQWVSHTCRYTWLADLNLVVLQKKTFSYWFLIQQLSLFHITINKINICNKCIACEFTDCQSLIIAQTLMGGITT